MAEYKPKLQPATLGWLDQRRKRGNWFDIAEADEIPADIEGMERTILQMFQIAFAPEIRRRISDGRLKEDFVLYAAQLLLREEGTKRLLRLNGEVRGIGLLRASGPIQKGSPVLMSDVRELVGFDLEEHELDAGHFTAFWMEEGQFISFDFRVGRAKCAEMLTAASEFLEASRMSAERDVLV